LDVLIVFTIKWALVFLKVYMSEFLVATGKPMGLILNFGERKVEIKRKVKDLK